MVTIPGVLISGHIVVGVIFSGRKGGYLLDPKFDQDSESGLKNRCYSVIYFEILMFLVLFRWQPFWAQPWEKH